MAKEVIKSVALGDEEESKVYLEYYMSLKADNPKLKFSGFVRDCIEYRMNNEGKA